MAYEVAAPQRVGPQKYGLFSLGTKKNLSTRVTAEEGVTFELGSCENLETYDLATCPTVAILKPLASRAIRGFEDPPVLPHGAYVALECSSAAGVYQDGLNEKTLDVFNRNIEYFIGQQFYQDLLVDPNLTPQGAGSPSCVLALGQSDVYTISGRGSVVFAPLAVVSFWTEGHAVYERDGQLWTSLGNRVVVIPEPQGVYTVFVSDSVPDVYLSEPQLLTDDAAVRIRRDNTVLSAVESQFTVIHDPCVLVSYDVTLGC